MKFKKKYQYIFFDLDNTLWDFNKNSYYALRETFHHFNLSEQEVSYESFHKAYSKFNELLWQNYRENAIVKKELTRLRFEKTFDALNISGVDPLEMNSYYLSEMPKQKGLVEGTEDILNYLKSKGYLLFIITNGFAEVQYKKLNTTGLTNYFSKVFISENIKSPKPSKEIFEYALKSANAKKSASLMVGDDLDTDVAGALNIGIDAVHYNPFFSGNQQGIFHEKRHSSIFFQINHLEKLKNII
jgi:putative hydrolase of the HAD superfamily